MSDPGSPGGPGEPPTEPPDPIAEVRYLFGDRWTFEKVETVTWVAARRIGRSTHIISGQPGTLLRKIRQVEDAEARRAE
jgi:hypothetical protein